MDDWNPRVEMALWGLILANLRDDRETESRVLTRLVADGVEPFDAMHAVTSRLNGALLRSVEDWPGTVADMVNHFGVDTNDLDMLPTDDGEHP